MAGNIHEYQTPNLGLQPSETGIDAIAQGARRIGSFYDQAGQDFQQLGSQAGSAVASAGQVAVDYMDHRDISQGAANGAQLMAKLNQQWEDTAKNADPNDPTIKQKFIEQQLEPALQDFQKGFNTEKSQDWAEHFVDSYRNHMFEKTAATMSALAGEAAKVNVAKTVNGLASAVAIDPSTHSIDNAFQVLDHSVGAMVDSSPNIDVTTGAGIKGMVAQDAKQQIVKSAVTSMIEKNPNVDLGALEKKYADYLKPGEMQMFQKVAQVQAKANALVEKQTTIANRQLAEQNVHVASAKALVDNVTFDQTTGQPIIDPNYYKDALAIPRKYPDAPNAASTTETMFKFGESQMAKGAKPVDDPATKTDLMDRMFSPDKPTTAIEIMKARAEGKLSDPSFKAMHDLQTALQETPLKGPVWQSVTSAVKEQLIRTDIRTGDKVGADQYAGFMQSFLPQYLAKSRDGTLPSNALDLNDPKSMISQTLQPYKPSMQGRLSATAAAPAAAPAAPAKPETPPAEGARKAADGNWYVSDPKRPGKYLRVDK